MNEYLPVLLGSIDERFLDYLDEDGEMLVDTVRRLRLYTNALLSGSISPAAVAEDWDDFYDLIPSFVTAYAPEWVGHLETMATFLGGVGITDHAPLSEDDVAYLMALEPVLDRYCELGSTEE
jgi:hypothetical protein